MLHRVIVLCAVLSPFVSTYPQAQYSTAAQTYTNPYEQQQQTQEYTDSPDVKIISSVPEGSTERAVARPVAKAYRSRARAQQLPANVQYQPVQSVPTEQPAQPIQPVQPVQPVQYQQPQPQQFEAQYVQRHRPQHPEQQFQQSEVAPHEHRHSSTTYIPILRFDKSQSLDGSYKQSWETGNNIIAEETGYLKNIGVKDQEALVQQGTYTYTAPDGSIITTSYTADEGGFHVEGSHLPTPPPIPEEIRKGLEQIYEGIRLQQESDAKDGKVGQYNSGQYTEEPKGKPSKYNSGQYTEENSVSDNYPAQHQQYQQFKKDQLQEQQSQQQIVLAQKQQQQQQYRRQQRPRQEDQTEQYQQ